METITFTCNNCGQQMTTEAIYCGRMVLCTQCGREIQIPLNKSFEQMVQIPPANMPQNMVKTNEHKNHIVAVLLCGITVLLLGCLLLLVRLSFDVVRSPKSYEYTVMSFDRYYQREFQSKIQEKIKDGWEYVGPLNSNNILLRRINQKQAVKK